MSLDAQQRLPSKVKAALEDFTKTGTAIERGQSVKKQARTYFTSFECFGKALTPKRLELLHIIKTEKPSSINELARCQSGTSRIAPKM